MTEIILLVLLSGFLVWLISLAYKGPDLSAFDQPVPQLVCKPDEVSDYHDTVVKILTQYNKQTTINVSQQRKNLEELFFREVDADIIPVDVQGIPAEWVMAPGADPDSRLLYLHGGAFRGGSPRSHRYITSELSKRTGVAVLAIDYRLQPEFKTIDCHADAQTAYRWIIDHGPRKQGQAKALFVAGDSAGGNLSLSVINYAKQNALTVANAVVAFAPATDSTLSSPTWKTNMATDPFLGPGLGKLLKIPLPIIRIFQRLAAGIAPNDPMLSPLFANLAGLPPTLIQVSRDEMLFGDAVRYANKARAEGGNVTLQVWPKMVHVFQGFGPELPEAVDALDKASSFIKSHQ